MDNYGYPYVKLQSATATALQFPTMRTPTVLHLVALFLALVIIMFVQRMKISSEAAKHTRKC